MASAFVWPHTRIQQSNGWIMGALVMAIAAVGTVAPRAHRLNAIVGFWLFVSAQELPSMTTATVMNNVLVGLAICLVALGAVGIPRWPGADGYPAR